MPLPQEQRYSYADLLEWEDNRHFELIHGNFIFFESLTPEHQRTSGKLLYQIESYLQTRKNEGQLFFLPFDVRLFEKEGDRPEDIDTVVQPDLMIICDPNQIETHGVRGAPDFIVEILSDTTLRYDRNLKYHLYQRAGVREYWIVDPITQTISVYTMEKGMYGAGEVYSTVSEKSIVPVGVLEDCSVDLTLVFPAES